MAEETRFELDDLLFIAMKIEKNGQKYYQTLFRKTSHPKAKKFFQQLAQDETRHEKDFLKIYDELKKTLHDFSCHFLEKIPVLVKVADQTVYTDRKMNEILRGALDNQALVDLALEAEDDSVRFYEEMKNLVDQAYKDVLDQIINEELGHKEKLLELREEANLNLTH